MPIYRSRDEPVSGLGVLVCLVLAVVSIALLASEFVWIQRARAGRSAFVAACGSNAADRKVATPDCDYINERVRFFEYYDRHNRLDHVGVLGVDVHGRTLTEVNLDNIPGDVPRTGTYVAQIWNRNLTAVIVNGTPLITDANPMAHDGQRWFLIFAYGVSTLFFGVASVILGKSWYSQRS